MKKRATQMAFDDTQRAPQVERAGAERGPRARKTPAEYEAAISNYLASADLEKKSHHARASADNPLASTTRHPTRGANPSAEPAILVREGNVRGMGKWRQYLVVTDDRVAVVHMEPALSGGWNIHRVDVQGHDAWAGMKRDAIIAWKLDHDDGLTQVAMGLGEFRTRLLEVARAGRLTR